MHEFGINAAILPYIFDGSKTIEVRLGKPKFIKLRVGDTVRIREDIYDGEVLNESNNDVCEILISQLLYFESFEELFSAVPYNECVPWVSSKTEALQVCSKLYSNEDEFEYGVIAIKFTVLNR